VFLHSCKPFCERFRLRLSPYQPKALFCYRWRT
jgi:hypothetical protein